MSKLYFATADGFCPVCNRKVKKGDSFKDTPWGHFHYAPNPESLRLVEALDSRFSYYEPAKSSSAAIKTAEEALEEIKNLLKSLWS